MSSIHSSYFFEMEKSKNRRNSTSSVHSQGTASLASIQCDDTNTHAIVQREKDKKVILVPLENFQILVKS